MNFYSIRVTLGVILLIFFALLSNLQLLKETVTFDLDTIGRDEITLYEKRFEELKKILPQRSIVGYIMDKQPKTPLYATEPIDIYRIREYYLTQYSLSPVIVVNTPNKQFVVGNFRYSVPDIQFFTDRNLTLIEDFGRGVLLFRSDAR